jgi:hypothetical protein
LCGVTTSDARRNRADRRYRLRLLATGIAAGTLAVIVLMALLVFAIWVEP